MTAEKDSLERSLDECFELNEGLLDLVYSKVFEQLGDGFGEIDLNLAVYFAYLETEESRTGCVPEYSSREKQAINLVVQSILEKSSLVSQ